MCGWWLIHHVRVMLSQGCKSVTNRILTKTSAVITNNDILSNDHDPVAVFKPQKREGGT